MLAERQAKGARVCVLCVCVVCVGARMCTPDSSKIASTNASGSDVNEADGRVPSRCRFRTTTLLAAILGKTCRASTRTVEAGSIRK